MDVTTAGAATSGDGGGSAAPSSTSTTTPSSAGAQPSAAQGAADGKPAPTKPGDRLKFKRGGQEREASIEEASHMLSDDYEHEWTGPGGKVVKTKWQDLVRLAQKGSGALEKMQKLAEREKEIAASEQWGRENVDAYLETRLGVQDVEKWVKDQARKMRDFDRKVELLMQPHVQGEDGNFYRNPHYNPAEGNRLLSERLAEKQSRRQAWEKSQAEQKQQAEQRQAESQKRRDVIGRVMSEHRLPMDEMTFRIASKIVDQHREANMELTGAELAQMTREGVHKSMHGYFNSLDNQGLASFLGDDLRAKLREYELEAVKAARKQERAEEKKDDDEPRQPAQRRPGGKLIEPGDFNRKYRMGGL